MEQYKVYHNRFSRALIMLLVMLLTSVSSWAYTEEELSIPLTLGFPSNGSDGTVTISNPIGLTMHYAIDGGAKQQIGGNTNDISITVTAGQTVQLYGDGKTNTTYSDPDAGKYTTISCSADCYIYGNIMSLMDQTGFASNTELTGNNAFGTSDNSVVTYPINYLPQNVPLLLEKSGTAGSTLTNTIYSGTELTDAERSSNILQYAEGDLGISALGGTPYILYKNEFVKASGTIPQNHCYLFITNPAPTRGYYSIGNGNDGSTAIDDTLIDNEETTNDDWYDLQGRRIQKPTKAGIYIVNGKKMIVK